MLTFFSQSKSRSFRGIIWVPRRTLVSNKILEDEGVLGDVNVSELPLFFLPLEDDMFSMEMDSAFSDLYLVCRVESTPESIISANQSTET